MHLLSEKSTRRHALFLCAVSLLIIFLTVLYSYYAGCQTRDLIYARESALVSSLLEEGVSSSVLASALKNTSVTENGTAFLQAAGRTDQTSLWLLAPSRSMFLRSLACLLPAALFFILLIFTGSWFFRRRREQLYLQASRIISRYADGDFSLRLPRGETGNLYGLFHSADCLATAFQARIESEHQSKEFLKDMISDISHQLKTPLAALRLYVDILAEEPGNPEAVRRFTDRSAQSIDRMESLILSLLKIMRLDTGSISFEPRPYPVEELMQKSSEDLFTRAEQEGKQLILEGDPSVTLTCDADWLAEAFGNLIKNALDHTAAGDIIRISWKSSLAMLRILVSDNGCGIAPEDIHHIFKRFYRGKQDRHTQGIGLGLPLAKSVIEGQGGTLSVQSSPGKGTTFTASFLTEM